MKIIYSKLSVLAVFLLLMAALTSCKKQLARINENPNAAENPQPDFLLTSAEKNTSDIYWGEPSNFGSSELIVQHWARIQYTDVDRYVYNSSSFTSLWSTLYSNTLTDLNVILQLAQAQQNDNYKGVAHVLRAWNFQLITDAYGAAPYKASGNIEENESPAYDSQKEIYEGIINELDSALIQLSESGPAISGDVIYSNNIALWRKFANSLKLRIALRISDAEPDLAKQVAGEVLSSNAGLISSNSETAQFVYQASPNWNPVANNFSTRNDYRISKTIVDKLYELNDPRLPVYANLPTDTSVKKYVGVPNGLTTSDANSLGLAKTSLPGNYFSAASAPAVIQSYAELLFLRAEAAARGFTAEDAASLYNQAITASLKQYNVADNYVNAYLAQPAVQYDAANYKKSIGEQKWIALFGQGLEAFAEWRRLDYPQLVPAVAGVLNGKIPVRFIYPGTEQSLNGKSYEEAVANQGTDVLTTRLWFDVK